MHPLICLSLSTNHVNFIQNNYILAAILAIGFNKIRPLLLRYGNHKLFVLWLRDIEVELVIIKIKDIKSVLLKTRFF